MAYFEKSNIWFKRCKIGLHARTREKIFLGKVLYYTYLHAKFRLDTINTEKVIEKKKFGLHTPTFFLDPHAYDMLYVCGTIKYGPK